MHKKLFKKLKLVFSIGLAAAALGLSGCQIALDNSKSGIESSKGIAPADDNQSRSQYIVSSINCFIRTYDSNPRYVRADGMPTDNNWTTMHVTADGNVTARSFTMNSWSSGKVSLYSQLAKYSMFWIPGFPIDSTLVILNVNFDLTKSSDNSCMFIPGYQGYSKNGYPLYQFSVYNPATRDTFTMGILDSTSQFTLGRNDIGFSKKTFEIIRYGYPKTALKSMANGKYVCCDYTNDSVNPPLVANRTSVGQWETFDIRDLGNGQVAIKNYYDKFVCADNGGNTNLIANRTECYQWETFDLIIVDSAHNLIALRSHANNKYVCAENGGSAPLIANRTAIGLWETFQAIPLP